MTLSVVLEIISEFTAIESNSKTLLLNAIDIVKPDIPGLLDTLTAIVAYSPA